jgi:uncharacterized protein (TIGR03067 family)
MRFILVGWVALATTASAWAEDKKEELPKELAPFQGTWKVVKASIGGMEVPTKEFEDGRFTFEGSKLTVSEGEKRKPDVGKFAVDASKDPSTIDLIQDAGKKAIGIYKFDKDGKLTLCFLKGEDSARPKDFDDKTAILLVLEKVKK